MNVETPDQKRMIQRWCRLAIQLNGANDTGLYSHITVSAIVEEMTRGSVFELLKRELPPGVWNIVKLTDADRHILIKHWRGSAEAFEPRQFHVERSGLALLVATVVGLIDGYHSVNPT